MASIVAELARVGEAVRNVQDQLRAGQGEMVRQIEKSAAEAEARRQTLHERIHGIANAVMPLPDKVEGLGKRIEQVELKLDGLSPLVRDHERMLEAFDDRLDALEKQQHEHNRRRWLMEGARLAVAAVAGAATSLLALWQRLSGH